METMALIIPFPTSAVFRSEGMVDALQKLGLCQTQIDDHEPGSLKHEVALVMLDFWESELDRMGGLSRKHLKQDGVSV